jgi:anti-sigma factor RsiW
MTREQLRDDDLHAYVDRQLDARRMDEVRELLATMPDLARTAAAYDAQKSAVHSAFDPILREPLPARLVHRAVVAPRGRSVIAAIGCLLLGVALGWWARGERVVDGRPQIAHQAATAHVVYVPEVRHPVEVTGKEEAHLVRWLSKRLGASIRAPRLASLGYELLGGRLLPEHGRPSAQFMYQDANGRRLTLYVSTDVQNRETAFRYAREGELHVFYWIDRTLGYALAGDVGKEEMLRVARVVYEQLNP